MQAELEKAIQYCDTFTFSIIAMGIAASMSIQFPEEANVIKQRIDELKRETHTLMNEINDMLWFSEEI